MGRQEDALVLEALRKIDVAGTKRVEAGDFQEVLQSAGVPLGSASADEIVLQCKVENDGRINYAPLEDAVMKSGPPPSPPKVAHAAPPSAPSQVQVPEPVAAAGAPIGQSTYPMQMSSGIQPAAAAGQAAPPALFSAPHDPKERVHRAVDALHHAFNQYDTGKCSLASLQHTIRELGLVETTAYHSLIRHGALDMTFAQLFQALLRIDPGSANQHKAGTIPGRRFASGAPRSTDVVTWRDNQGSSVEGLSRDRQPPAPPISPRARESVASPWHTAESDNDPYAPHVYVAQPPKSAAHPSRRRFEPGMMEALSSHIVFDDVSEKLALSKEKEVLKENIYQCIRQLDQGQLTSETFTRKIHQLGVAMPEEASHGDLIAWSHAPNLLEATEIEAHRIGRRYEHSYDAHHSDHIDLSWDTERRPPAAATAAATPTLAAKSTAHVRPYSRPSYGKDVHHKPTLGMLAWDVAEKK
ncbi:Myosin regulatory light chain [Hondaea fermentalgiana]|uniref:Myosin regulatory light chain n=1 Tax=Hondaea fermentalgiana TaxID=2315210 RepID=A0A2R5G107_9STRA|nr:Myosin regulatory light chain [Hondaea fermentalgiana]|eukprot:GBG24690.1 Myosin regulatory light chain [Hondaea fermentalgiana]